MFVAIVTGASIWYPAVLGQPLFVLLNGVPVAGVVALLIGGVVLGACFAGRPGKRVRLAVALIVFGALSPVPLIVRTAFEGVIGRRPDVVVLGIDSVSHDDGHAQISDWVNARGGVWYTKAVAPGLLTNPVWTSVLTMQPLRAHGVFHAFQHLPPAVPRFISAARAAGYRTVSVFPDQFTTAVGSRAGFDEDRSGPVGWRQLLLATVADNSLLLPLLKPALPRLWPSPSPWNHAGTFTYDVRREVRAILRAGSRTHRTLVAAHLTYAHIRAYPATMDLSWEEVWSIARSPAGAIRDRTFDWQDVDRLSDPVPLNAWKLRHLQRVIASEVDTSRFLADGGQLVLFSDHGNRAGLSLDTFGQERYYRVLLATVGLPARCPQEPISLIDIGSLVGLAETRAEPSVEFAIAPEGLWPALVQTARLRWPGDVELDEGSLAEIFSGLRRYDPWPGEGTGQCAPAVTGR